MASEGDVILMDGVPQTINERDLNGDFTFYASDTGATPLSEAVKKQEFLAVMPTLIEMGVPQQEVLAHLINMMGLPQSFITSLEGAVAQEQPMATTQAQQDIVQSQGMQGQPSPQDIQQFLPQ